MTRCHVTKRGSQLQPLIAVELDLICGDLAKKELQHKALVATEVRQLADVARDVGELIFEQFGTLALKKSFN
ncbi:hypothetical protein D9M68_759250 [compost metagenome]